ncbi:hypothetical protein COLO4_01682 [Corchorus olitorius]|uniref:Uncharacterized protein n=1 Tax=Corchorus olitorius TaxID=93759 RepID=A0A1R3L2D7_9ROSI|nr:hypothetical protein COLO4_01682 [Corchorus olitorius]
MAVHVFGVDADRRLTVGSGQVAGAERHFFEQAFEQGVQATGTDVLGLLVDLPGDLGEALDALRGELDMQAFGLEQLAVLQGQRSVRLAEDALEVFRAQGLEFDADRQAALQLGNQVARLAQVERAGSDEQDVVGLDHAQLGVDGAAFDQRQQVALHAFARDIGTADVAALGDLVDLVDEHDAMLLDRFQGLGLEFFLVDQALCNWLVISSMPGGAEISTPMASATSISISLSSSWPSRRRLRNSWRVLESALGAASSLKPARAGGSRASRIRSSAASSARWRTRIISCSRSILIAASARSRMIDSTSRPT